MNHYMKRVLALLLCFAMLLPMFPNVVFAAVSAPSGLTAVEAENRFCAIWNTFTNVEGNGSRTDCSGGSMVGSGSHGKNIAFDDLNQTADLSDTAYVKWLVEAPADGNYNISLRYLLKTTSISNNTSFTSTPYAAFFVNGETAYKANFQGKNNWVSNTDSVSVSLKKGVNEIVAIPLVKDVIQSLGGSCWANVDCLYIQDTLTSVKNVVEAENTDYTVWNSYSTTESNTNASGGIQVGGANTDSNVHYADLQAGVDLSSTAYVKWTVDAPAAGNYDIAARAHISISGSHTGSLKEKVYVTFFVNGQTPYKAAFNGEKGWVYDTQTVSVALNEGKNEIIAIPLVRDIFDDLSLTWGWANMDCLYMDTRLQAVENEKMPAMQTVEAENTLYASWNSYTKSEENVNASGGVLVGSGNQAHNIAYADLTEGVDLSETAYVKWTVHAPHAGAYYIGLRYQPYADRYGNNQAMDPRAYASFFINGKDAYQAAFTGKSNWVSDTQPIPVNLAAGDNEIVAIALVKELLEAYEGGWANIDCLYIQEGLTPVKNRIEAENTTYAVWNNFETTENRTDASNGVIVGGGKHGKNSSFAELKADADLSDTAYIKWYVEAPADGAYAVALRYLMKVNGISNNAELDPQAYAVFFVNGKTPYKAAFTGKNGWVSDTQSVTLTLKKGINEIIAIPLVKDIITALGESWANVDCLYLDTRLTPKVPEAPAVLKPVEAENTLYAQWNNYSTVEGPRADAHAGGYLVGGAKLENNLLYSQLTEGADLSGTAYIQWTVTAPEDGEYAIGLRYLMNTKPLPSGELLDSGAYCTFFINGKDVYRADFTGKDNWVSDTKTVEVTLKKGENKIIAIPFIRDLMDSYGAQDPGYANVDCLYIEDTLKAVPAVKLEAEDTQSAGWNQFDTTLEHTAASGNTLVSGETAQNVAFDDLSAGVDLTDTAYIRWTLNAPADGEYYVALRYLSELNEDAYAAVFVNGETAYKAVFLGENNSIGDTQALRLTLRKGSNTLVVIPVTAEQTGTAKVDCLYIDSRLSAVRNRLEAENSIYTAWNVYNKVENNKSASAGAVVGGGDASRNIYYADLIPGVKLGKTSFVKWNVEAPTDGEYTIALRYSVKADKKDNDTRLSPAAYAAFFVNGETAYKAQFLGKNNWVYDTETITLTLHAGTNEIIAVPLVKDLYDAWGGGWANVDCVYLDGKLTVLRAPEILPDYITVEAEDQTKTTWNIYSTTETNHDASGKTTVGGSDASKNVYFADLVPGVKLGNTAYVKWAVNAPADGEYTVALRYQVKAGNQSNNTDLDPAAYAVFFVNGKTPYQATFQGKNNWTYDTETITVTLKKGRNEIVAIPLIRDLVDAYSWGYANVDCVYLDGKLTVLDAPEIPADDRPDPAPHKIEAEDQTKTTWNIYSTTETNHDASGKTTVGGSDASKNVYFADLVPGVKLGNTAYVKWAVNAPADGEYTVALRYQVKAGNQSNNTDLDPAAYAVFFVNGKTPYQATFQGKNNWTYDTETITVTLKKGRNEIVAIPLIRDLVDAYSWGYANVDCVYLDGKLTVLAAPEIPADDRPDPAPHKIEAEDQTKTAWNIYSTTETNHDASGKTTVGGSDASKNVYFADLVPGVKLGNTAYVKWAVNAPADGEYTVALRYQVKAGNQSNNTDLDPAAYAVFFVNGKTPYQATFQGKNNWTYDTETITVTLKKGRNEIVAIPLIRDLVDAYSWGYANVDCVYLDGKLTVLAAPEIPADDRPDPAPHKIEAEDQTKTAWNIYSTTETNHDASGKTTVGGSDASKNVYFADLVPGVKLGNTAYVKWAVNAPADGEYTVALRYQVKAGNQSNNTDLDPAAYAVFFVNGKTPYQATFQGKNNWTYDTETITVTLKKGRNEIVAIPLIRDLVDAYSWGYANVDCVYLDGKLTVLAAPKLPENEMPPPEMLQVEAEDAVYTVWNSYSTVQEHSSAQNGKLAAGSAANKNVYYAELVPGVDLSRTAYVQWTFVAPEEGDYKFSLRYNPKADGIEIGEELKPVGYAAFFVNGKTAYQAEFLGKNNWVYDTQTIKLHLKKGENTVVAIPMVKDLYDAWGGGWANVDCLYYDGKLTIQKAPAKKTVEAEDRSLTYWNGYTSREEHRSASGGYQAAGSSSQNNVYFSQLKKGVDLTYTAYVKWVIHAPTAGNYTFSLRYAPKASKAKDGAEIEPGAYAAFFVNGETAYQAEFLGYNNWVYNTKEITIPLEKGDNELIVIPMVKDLYDAWGGGWANVDCLYMDEALSVKNTGYVEDHRITVEAEDTNYVQWNLYSNTETHSSASGKLVAAGSDAAANLYLADLKKGADLSGTAYLKWTIIAPESGNYSFALRYAAKEDGVKSGDRYEKANAYATFFVNGETYQAALTGFGARCNWLWNTQDVNIYLHAGENELYCIPLVKDLYDAWGGGWANVDCLYMEPSLSLKKAPVYTRFEAENSEFNLYEGFATRVGTEDWSSAYENDVTFDNLNEETIVAVSHVKYYVYAEKAGTYRLGFGFRQGHNKMEYLDAFFGLSVNLESYHKVPFIATNAGNNRLTYFDVELKEGDNYIYCTACLKDLMEYPQYPSQKNGYVLWIDHDYILLPEGLTSVVAGALPNWTGDADADYNQSLLSVWGDLTPPENQPEDTQPQLPTEPAMPEKPGNGFVWACILSGTALVTLLLIILLAKKKKKQ